MLPELRSGQFKRGGAELSPFPPRTQRQAVRTRLAVSPDAALVMSTRFFIKRTSYLIQQAGVLNDRLGCPGPPPPEAAVWGPQCSGQLQLLHMSSASHTTRLHTKCGPSEGANVLMLVGPGWQGVQWPSMTLHAISRKLHWPGVLFNEYHRAILFFISMG
ncbi:hypothetical protein XELAEV_18024059mg [Xenopus laevis]|uniref:Uncharacterized protein n=1 Tax=Xenopus laevis TaxID=8355 RepID=A0A974D848_XENLA|nr:hypothetical protein XELAEV_18024059mg [Xenopus laevis]